MTKRKRLRDEDADRLLEGRVGPSDPDLGELHGALGRIRDHYGTSPAGDVRRRHLAAMAAAFGTEPTTAAVSVRRRPAFRRTSIATAALVLIGASALAATGTLPGPAQDSVANVVHKIGLNLPKSSHKPEKTSKPERTAKPSAAFVDAKKRWTQCVSEHPGGNSEHGECGPKPERNDFKPSATPKLDEGGAPGNSDEHRNDGSDSGPDSTPHPNNGGHGNHGGKGGGGSGSGNPDKTPHPTGGD